MHEFWMNFSCWSVEFCFLAVSTSLVDCTEKSIRNVWCETEWHSVKIAVDTVLVILLQIELMMSLLDFWAVMEVVCPNKTLVPTYISTWHHDLTSSPPLDLKSRKTDNFVDLRIWNSFMPLQLFLMFWFWMLKLINYF